MNSTHFYFQLGTITGVKKIKTIVYNESMAQVKKEKLKNKSAKAESLARTRLILPGEEMPAAEDIDENEGGMFQMYG